MPRERLQEQKFFAEPMVVLAEQAVGVNLLLKNIFEQGFGNGPKQKNG